MKRTYWYAATTKDEAQNSRMTFYKAVNNELCGFEKHKSTIYQEFISSQHVPVIKIMES